MSTSKSYLAKSEGKVFSKVSAVDWDVYTREPHARQWISGICGHIVCNSILSMREAVGMLEQAT
ncbi:MAG: hypothetical protein AAGM67_21375, partial [Bacteroidota bacterium]